MAKVYLPNQQYIKRHGMFDEMDLVFHIYQRLEAARQSGNTDRWAIHEVSHFCYYHYHHHHGRDIIVNVEIA